MRIAYLGIGTNLGNRERNLEEAIAKIRECVGSVLMSSSIYETEPWGFRSENDFLNIVVMVETTLTPSGLLGKLLIIESLLGRVRGEKHYESRQIDIDILFYDDLVIDEISLKVPHPLLYTRRFVLIPLCEIDPAIVHPVFKKTVASLLKSCEDKSQVRKYS
jgi:2-amino-4-hydroxy-6-hydroxymethyldihydropteridine diphosphokinase